MKVIWSVECVFLLKKVNLSALTAKKSVVEMNVRSPVQWHQDQEKDLNFLQMKPEGTDPESTPFLNDASSQGGDTKLLLFFPLGDLNFQVKG